MKKENWRYIKMGNKARLKCSKCGRLLGVGVAREPVEIKCPRCKQINRFMKG